tara:strand:+ start:380 stop:508 length:129 start_codon:yes stop_codon:yes gene_type:complete
MIEVFTFIISVGIIENVAVPTYETGKRIVTEHVIEYFKAMMP